MAWCPYQDMRVSNAFFPNCTDLPKRLMKAMKGEADARVFYLQLISMLPAPEDKDIVAKIAQDEKKHHENFRRLYVRLAGHEPMLPPTEKANIPTYIEGIMKAIMDETEAYEFYRDTFMCTTNPAAKEIFLEAMTDENEHAIRLNYLFTKNK